MFLSKPQSTVENILIKSVNVNSLFSSYLNAGKSCTQKRPSHKSNGSYHLNFKFSVSHVHPFHMLFTLSSWGKTPSLVLQDTVQFHRDNVQLLQCTHPFWSEPTSAENRKLYRLSFSNMKDFSLPLVAAYLQFCISRWGGRSHALPALLPEIYTILCKADTVYDGYAV